MTPTASTPTGRDELIQYQQQLQHANDLFGTLRTKRTPLHHHLQQQQQSIIDARVESMKQEFYAYRKKKAIKRAGIVLESAC
jgi:vacuolar-type H+-ATPase subunit D/Vma8